MNKRTWLWVVLIVLGTAIYLVVMASPMPNNLKTENPVEILAGILLIAGVLSSPIWLILLVRMRRR